MGSFEEIITFSPSGNLGGRRKARKVTTPVSIAASNKSDDLARDRA